MGVETDTTPRYLREIIADGACEDAVAWARAYATPEAMWAACERPDWMLWLAGRRAGPKHHPSRVMVVRVACEIARLVLPIFEKARPGDERPRKAIEAAEAYANAPGEGSANGSISAAAYAADAAAYAATDAADAAAYAAADAADAATDAATDAADAAAYAATDDDAAAAAAAVYAATAAAYAACAAAYAACAADAAYAAADAAAASAADAARIKTKDEVLAIVRKHYPTMPERAS